MKVHISIGTPTNADQKKFLDNLMDILRNKGLVPFVYGHIGPATGAPLEAINKSISESCGVIVVAYGKYKIEKGTEYKRNWSSESIDNKFFSTSWNQIETSLAYSNGIKPFVLVEKSVHQSGLLEPGHPWHIHSFDFNQNLESNYHITSSLDAWIKESIQTFPKRKKKIDSNAGLAELWRWFIEQRVHDQAKTLVFLFSIFSIGMALRPGIDKLWAILTSP